MEVLVINDEIAKEINLVGDLFRQLLDKYNKMENKKHLYRDLKELTLIDINTILVIGCGEMKSMSQIARQLGVSSGTPTVTVDRLISKKLVERIRDEEDRRQVFVRLSDKGKGIFHSVVELQQRFTEKFFGILKNEERQFLIEILTKLNTKFDEVFETIL